jgi:hypothetical protein
MAYNDLNHKLEEAMKSLVDALALDGVTVNTGATQSEMEAPYVLCSAPGGGSTPENLKDTGIYVHEATVIVSSSLDDVADMATHRARVASVFDTFRDDAIATSLSDAVSDFHVYDVDFISSDMEEEERKVTNTLGMEIVCCASDIN